MKFSRSVKRKTANNTSGMKKKKAKFEPRMVNIEDLEWNQVSVPEGAYQDLNDDEMGGILCFEEIDNVDVVIDQGSGGKVVSFKQIAPISKPEPTTEPLLEFSDETLEISPCTSPVSEVNTKSEEPVEAAVTEESAVEEHPFVTEETANSTWSGLNEKIVSRLNELNFVQPTEIQSKVLQQYSNGVLDIIGVAETGSGKTLAFGLPILNELLLDSSKFCLIVAPTRELAVQIVEHLRSAAKLTSIKIISLVGGLSAQKQKRLVQSNPQIAVATPGRLWDLINDDDSFKKRVVKCDFLVIDEADRMLEKGHFAELTNLLQIVSNENRKTMLFSATLVPNDQLKSVLQGKHKNIPMANLLASIKFKKEPMYINVVPKNNIMAKSLVETKIECMTKEKDLYLYYIVTQNPGRTLVFVNSIDGIRRLVPIFQMLMIPCYGLHAEMQQRQRLKNLDRFKSQENAVLVASDVAARGLDIPNVEHVIHYQLPRSADLYVHRSGRTARASNHGISVLLTSPEEFKVYKKICAILKRTNGLDDYSVDQLLLSDLKPRVELAKKINTIEHQNQKRKHEAGWLQKQAQEAEILLDSDDEAPLSSTDSLTRPLKNQLSQLLAAKAISTSQKRLFHSGNGIKL